ncbi:alpha/beta hydrolase family protein [Sphingomonas sp. MMS12-HWE2-04]|uniref:alpha/beta hydrolase family protein n=1 Tax=Sphingomonas sp. MMS12-HWE2-04 TaxID=3234199 RepID=UPI00384C2736
MLFSRAASADTTPPSIAALVAPASIEDPALSPDGAFVAAKTLVDGRPRLALFDADDPAKGARPVALPEIERLEWYRWLAPGRLLVSLLTQGARPTTRLIAVDVAGGRLVQIGPVRDAAEGSEVIHIDVSAGFLLLESVAPEQQTPSVYRLDLASGAMRLAVAAQPHVWDWYVDSAGVVRAGMAVEGKQSWMLYRRHDGDRFSRSAKDARGIELGRFEAVRGSDQGYAMAEARSGRIGLFRYDFAKGRLGALVYENPQVDVDSFETGEDGRLLAVSYSGDRDQTLWFDPALAARQRVIDAAIPGRVNRILSSSADERRLLIWSGAATDPGAFYLYSDGRASLLAPINAALAGAHLSEMTAIRYRARDGLMLSGYLTLPVGRDPRKLPLIVMPHGGPFARDDWGYDPWVQYLAGKGYAVLQPNFRGSTGFGRDFVEKGDGAWGRGMQDDVDDGVAWLAQQGIADAGRVCIMGASFGGYAAMWAAVRDPDKYRCAIAFAGISDVGAQLDYDHKTFEEKPFRAWRRRIQGKAPSLDALSPIKFVDRMTVPILIGHGTDDDTVPPDQSIRLHDALTRLGRDHGYVAYPGAGHSLDTPEDNEDFLQRVGRFLDAHNPA